MISQACNLSRQAAQVQSCDVAEQKLQAGVDNVCTTPHNNITQQRNTTHLQQHEDGQAGHYHHIHSDPCSQDSVLLHTPARGPVPVSGLLQVNEVHHSQRYKVDARIWEADIISINDVNRG